jgi:hypothetical protein
MLHGLYVFRVIHDFISALLEEKAPRAHGFGSVGGRGFAIPIVAPRPRRSPSRPGVSIPQSGAAELPSIRGAANIGRRATYDDPHTFLKLLKIDVFVVSQPPVNDPVVHLSLAYKHAPFLKGHDQIEVVYFDGAAMSRLLRMDAVGIERRHRVATRLLVLVGGLSAVSSIHLGGLSWRPMKANASSERGTRL